MNTTFKPGKVDPGTQVLTDLQPCSPACMAVLVALGFKDASGDGRTFVYNNRSRAIWVDSVTDPGELMPLICQQAEETGRRTKINEIRKVLDIPFGEISEDRVDLITRQTGQDGTKLKPAEDICPGCFKPVTQCTCTKAA